MATPRARFSAPYPARPPLTHFVVLSILLHLWVILLFGTPSGGGAPGGKALWGSLQLTLQAPLVEQGLDIKSDRSANPQLPGETLIKRWLGAPQQQSPQPNPESPVTPAAPVQEPAVPVPADTLPRLDPEAPNLVDKAIAPQTKSDTSIPQVLITPAPLLEPIAPSKPMGELAPPVLLPPAEVPVVPTPLLEKITPAKIGRELMPPPELPPAAVPAVPTPLLERVAPTRFQRELAPPVQLPPPDVPVVPTPLLESVAPSRFARELAPPVTLPPPEVPAVPVPKSEAIQSPAVEPRPAAPTARAPATQVERSAPTAGEREPATKTSPSPRPESVVPVLPEDPFQRRREAAPASAEPGSGPRIDLEAARKRAREMAREGSGQRAILPFPMPPKEERKSKEAIAIEKALKPDCRTAYSDLGLLAVAPLVLNAFGEGTCKW